MNIGVLALIPSRRSAITWPISCRNSSTTNPAANSQPQNRLYAATDTSAVPDVVSSFSLRQQQQHALDRRAELRKQRRDRRQHAADAPAQTAHRALAGARRRARRRGCPAAAPRAGGSWPGSAGGAGSPAVPAATAQGCPYLHCGTTAKRCLTNVRARAAGLHAVPHARPRPRIRTSATRFVRNMRDHRPRGSCNRLTAGYVESRRGTRAAKSEATEV